MHDLEKQDTYRLGLYVIFTAFLFFLELIMFIINAFDVQNFPLPVSSLNDVILQKLGKSYLKDIKSKGRMLTRIQKQTGETKTQSFKISQSKPIIDEIDNVLATHYGFTPEELDFIINYDIKYRVGAELDDEE